MTEILATSRHAATTTTALRDVTAAGATLGTAKRGRSDDTITRADRELRSAVDRARQRGAQWGQIGLALGIAQGNAYQRYRPKPLAPSTVDHAATAHTSAA